MKDGYRQIFLGLFFATFHISFGTLQILPTFVGWMMVAYGISMLQRESDSNYYKNSYLYAGITVGISFLNEIFSWIGLNQGLLRYTLIVVAVFELLFIQYFIRESIAYLYHVGLKRMASNIEKKRSIYLIMYMIYIGMQLISLVILNYNLFLLSSLLRMLLILWIMLWIYQMQKRLSGKSK